MKAISKLDQNSNILNNTYEGIPVLQQIKFALSNFYSTPCHNKKETPEQWNPIFLHYTCGIFDPTRVGPSDYLKNGGVDALFQPWEGASGVQRTEMFLEKTKKMMDEQKYYDNSDALAKKTPEHTMSTHFIITREVIDDNTDILGFYHIESRKFKRYLIKDVRRLCELLRFSNHDFTRIFGYPESDSYEFYNDNLSKEEFESEVSMVIENARNIDITDKNILTMLSYLRDTGDNVVSLFSKS